VLEEQCETRLVTDAFSTSFTFIHGTTSTNQDASETKAETHPGASSYNSQGLDETRHRILQVLRQHVCLFQPIHRQRATQFVASRILFQRGVYPSDDFQMVKKYGQTVLITQDAALEAYLDRFVSSLPASSPCSFINGDTGY
jgi:hypothetical protein